MKLGSGYIQVLSLTATESVSPAAGCHEILLQKDPSPDLLPLLGRGNRVPDHGPHHVLVLALEVVGDQGTL